MKISSRKIRHATIKFFRTIRGPRAHAIYAGVGVVAAVGSTGHFTWQACKKAQMLKQENPEITKLELAKELALYYIIPTATTATTIACLAKSSRSYRKTIHGLSKAYNDMSLAMAEYKALAVGVPAAEVLGGYSRKPEKIVVQDNEKVYYDVISHRYFKARPEVVANAKYLVNEEFGRNGDVPLSDYYDFLGIESTDYGEYVHWNSEFIYDEWEDVFLPFDEIEYTMEDGGTCTMISPIYLPRYYDDLEGSWKLLDDDKP